MKKELEGFKKVAQEGGIFIVATFFNPETGETKTQCVRDYDYADCSRDDDELYYMPIDEQAKRQWEHKQGKILEGDTVKVVKGRKVKVGTVSVVKRTRKVNDRYGRWVADYLIFENGEQTNVENCEVIQYA